MSKKTSFTTLAIVLLLCLASLSGSSRAESTEISAGNLINNGLFESGEILPSNWYPDAWVSGADFVWDNTQSYEGDWSIKISQATPNDTRWVQGVTVQPNTNYRLSGWIKTENVAHSQDPVDAGANFSIYGTWTHTQGLFGTNEWARVRVTFNSGSSSRIIIAARLGYWSGTTSGTAWFDDLRLEPVDPAPPITDVIFLPFLTKSPCVSTSPSWKILFLVYETTDFTFTDDQGQHHFVANMTQAEKDKIAYAATRFVNEDIPALNSCYMQPTLEVRYVAHPLSNLTALYCDDYSPSPYDAAPDRDSAFDSVITIWDGSGSDLIGGGSMSIQGCAWAWGMGTGQTYDAIYVDMLSYTNRNVLKHEWGHSILFYYDAAGTAPKPAVDNHINDTTNSYVNCLTGGSYILQDEDGLDPIPNSIYNNGAGFTKDYYSGLTARAEQPAVCLGIPASDWATGGPVSAPILVEKGIANRWRSPDDDVITVVVPYFWEITSYLSR